MIRFTVPAIPIAQPRQRHAMIGGHIRNYTPSNSPVNAFKASVRHEAALAHTGAPLEGPLHLHVIFLMPRPKSKTKKRGSNPSYWHTGRPDIDNLCKSLKDALSGLLWRDDSQVSCMLASKRVVSADEQPHVVVSIQPLTEATP